MTEKQSRILEELADLILAHLEDNFSPDEIDRRIDAFAEDAQRATLRYGTGG